MYSQGAHKMKNQPLSRKSPSQYTANTSVVQPWRYVLLIIICACLLAAGFFFAARQHFMSMDYGIRNSRLRKQVEDLESEKQRLMLAREVALSPAEIKKTARHLGFGEITIAAVTSAPAAKSPAASVSVTKVSDVKTPRFAVSPETKPVKAFYQQTVLKTAMTEKSAIAKPSKKLASAKVNGEKPALTAYAKLR